MLTRAPAHSAPIHDRAFALGQDWRFLKYLFHKCVNIIAWWSISHLSLIVRCSCTKPLPALSRRIYHSSFTLPRSTHFPHTKSPLEGTLVHQSTCRSIKMKKRDYKKLGKSSCSFSYQYIGRIASMSQVLKGAAFSDSSFSAFWYLFASFVKYSLKNYSSNFERNLNLKFWNLLEDVEALEHHVWLYPGLKTVGGQLTDYVFDNVCAYVCVLARTSWGYRAKIWHRAGDPSGKGHSEHLGQPPPQDWTLFRLFFSWTLWKHNTTLFWEKWRLCCVAWANKVEISHN